MEQEIWKNMEEFGGIYYISSLGKVKGKFGIKKPFHEIGRYLNYTFYYKGKVYSRKLHKLLGKYFIENPNNYKCINHIDGDKLNNCISNLEWCTYKHNLKHAYSNNLRSNWMKDNPPYKGKIGINHPCSKPIEQMSNTGEHIRYWENSYEIERHTGLHASNISSCCKGKLKTSGGYLWKYI